MSAPHGYDAGINGIDVTSLLCCIGYAASQKRTLLAAIIYDVGRDNIPRMARLLIVYNGQYHLRIAGKDVVVWR